MGRVQLCCEQKTIVSGDVRGQVANNNKLKCEGTLDMSDYADAGAWLKGMRRAAEITAGELAEMLLVDESSVKAAESGRYVMDEDKLTRAARVFGLSARHLKDTYRAHLGLNKVAA